MRSDEVELYLRKAGDPLPATKAGFELLFAFSRREGILGVFHRSQCAVTFAESPACPYTVMADVGLASRVIFFPITTIEY
jgi:hypothetical protein